MKDSCTVRRCLLSALVALLFTAAPASAQTFTWTGGGANNNWNTAANWDLGAAPSDNLDTTLIVLTGNTQTTNNLDRNFFANSLTFDAGAGAFTVGGTNTLTLGTGGLTVLGTNNQVFNAPLALGAAGTWANNGTGLFTVGGGVNLAGNVLIVGGSGESVYTGVISNGGSMTKVDAGTVTVSGANTFTGETSVIGGVLSLGNNAALGAGGAGNETTVFNGATARLGGGLTVAEPFTLNGNGVAGVGALDKVGVADSTVSGAITLGSASRIGSSEGTLNVTGGILGVNTNLSFGGSGNVTVNTTGILIGTGSVTKIGAGTLTMNLASTYSGGTSIQGGTVVLGNTGALGSGNVAIAPASAADASLLLNAAGTFSRPISIGVLNDTGTGRVVIGSQTGLTGSSVFSATPLIVRRPFTIQAGASIATTFSFVEFRQEGTTVAHMTISAPTPATETNNRVIFHSPVVASTFGDMTIGDLAGPHAVVQFGSGDNSGNIVPDGSVINFFRAPGGGNGGSVLLLSPGPSPTGETVGALHSLETGAGTITTFNADVGNSVYTLTVGGGDKSGTFSGVITQGAGTDNADVAIAKIGTGTQILSGNNTYTAGTTVSGGTLLANGQSGSNSGTGTGAVTVNNGGTFGGTGRAEGAVTVNGGGTIRGGDATGVGTLTLGNGLTMNSGAILGLRITLSGAPASETTGGSSNGVIPNPTNNNFIDMQASTLFSLDPETQFVVDATGTAFVATNSYSYRIGRVNQNLNSLSITDQSQFTTIGFTDEFDFSITGDGAGVLYLNIVQPIPEPATVLALAAGVLGGGTYLRRRLRREQPTAQGA